MVRFALVSGIVVEALLYFKPLTDLKVGRYNCKITRRHELCDLCGAASDCRAARNNFSKFVAPASRLASPDGGFGGAHIVAEIDERGDYVGFRAGGEATAGFWASTRRLQACPLTQRPCARRFCGRHREFSSGDPNRCHEWQGRVLQRSCQREFSRPEKARRRKRRAATQRRCFSREDTKP